MPCTPPMPGPKLVSSEPGAGELTACAAGATATVVSSAVTVPTTAAHARADPAGRVGRKRATVPPRLPDTAPRHATPRSRDGAFTPFYPGHLAASGELRTLR